MVHISGDGQVVESKPWSITRFLGGLINAVTLFFSTLISPDSTRNGNRYSRDYRPGSGPRPPNRRMGRINTMRVDVPIPGGCQSCSR